MGLERSPTNVPDPDPRERALAHSLGLPDLMARVLLARGVDDPGQVRGLLHPDLRSLAPPTSFTQMDRAVERVRKAIAGHERIAIHGDYDVDGVCGTVLLLKLFALVGADAFPFIPDRRDGYSFTASSHEAVTSQGATLCISVDNGTNAGEWIERIQADGCDVIVTDHHGTSQNVAAAYAVLNPRLPDAGYPDRELAGVGVAFRLAAAVADSFTRGRKAGDELRSFLLDAMAYVALGTVADVAPLRGENRVMVHHGLRALAVSANPGIRALLDAAGLSNRSPDAEDIAFRIAPLINAAGRMGSALEAVQLLLAPGYSEAQEAAKKLETHNLERRKVERAVLQEAVEQAQAAQSDRVLVLAGDDWHPGVLGIVAARIAETQGKPAILLSFEGDRARGSGRSPTGIHLREALGACAEHLVTYGGHAAAAGMEIERNNLDAFRVAINRFAVDHMDTSAPIETDGLASFKELDPHHVRKLDQLGPFGAGNKRPTFLARGVRIVGNPAVDTRGHDLRVRLAQEGVVLAARVRGGAGLFESLRGFEDPVEVVFHPRISSRGENGPLELQVLKMQRAEPPSTSQEAQSNGELA